MHISSKRILLLSLIAVTTNIACTAEVTDSSPLPATNDTVQPAADEDPFVAKSHSAWSGVSDSDVLAVDIGNDGSDHVYTWRYSGPDSNHGTVCRGTSTSLCGSSYPFSTPLSKYGIQAIAIAKDTQKVYSYYTYWDSPTSSYKTKRMIGKTDDLGYYSVVDAPNIQFSEGTLVDVAIATNGYVYYYSLGFNHVYRDVGDSLNPCSHDCSFVVSPTRSGGADTGILGIAFNAAGTEYAWYTNSGFALSLNTGTDSTHLW